MYGYICFWNGKQCEVYANTLFAAKDLAIEKFKTMAGRKKVKSYDVTVVLAEKNGEQVTHSTSEIG